MKILIVGATGFCGRAVTQILFDEGHEVIAHIRPNSSRLDTMSAEWSARPLTLLVTSWDQLLESLSTYAPQVIISLIGTTARHARRGEGGYEEVDYGLNARLIKSARELTSPPLIIYLSSMGIEWGKWSAYLNARVRIESALSESGLPHIILRPGMLSGASRDELRPLEKGGTLLARLLSKTLKLIGLHTLSLSYRPLDAPEVGLLIAALLTRHAPDHSMNTSHVELERSLSVTYSSLDLCMTLEELTRSDEDQARAQLNTEE
jgi:uncharacterized protein YbjT (DUF2867 family)